MPNNPYDDVFKNLAKMMEDILKNLPNQGPSHVVHYTIIAEPGEAPRVFQGMDDELEDIPYEMIETGECIYITAEIEPDIEPPDVEIEPRTIRILEEDGETVVELDCEVDTEQSYYNIHHGILDIVCIKR